jgi:hypothetical protein
VPTRSCEKRRARRLRKERRKDLGGVYGGHTRTRTPCCNCACASRCCATTSPRQKALLAQLPPHLHRSDNTLLLEARLASSTATSRRRSRATRNSEARAAARGRPHRPGAGTAGRKEYWEALMEAQQRSRWRPSNLGPKWCSAWPTGNCARPGSLAKRWRSRSASTRLHRSLQAPRGHVQKVEAPRCSRKGCPLHGPGRPGFPGE